MSESALFREGIIARPHCLVYLAPKRRTTSAGATFVLGRQVRGSTMAGPPSVEEPVGGRGQQRAELVSQRLGQMGGETMYSNP
jgi:hypothetical protein